MALDSTVQPEGLAFLAASHDKQGILPWIPTGFAVLLRICKITKNDSKP
jgi:hypothetical protein